MKKCEQCQIPLDPSYKKPADYCKECFLELFKKTFCSWCYESRWIKKEFLEEFPDYPCHKCRKEALHATLRTEKQLLNKIDNLLEEVDNLRLEKATQENRIGNLLEEVDNLRLEKANQEREPRVGAFDQNFLMDLIFLVHPDKHSNSDRATRVTQQLLKLRV